MRVRLINRRLQRGRRDVGIRFEWSRTAFASVSPLSPVHRLDQLTAGSAESRSACHQGMALLHLDSDLLAFPVRSPFSTLDLLCSMTQIDPNATHQGGEERPMWVRINEGLTINLHRCSLRNYCLSCPTDSDGGVSVESPVRDQHPLKIIRAWRPRWVGLGQRPETVPRSRAFFPMQQTMCESLLLVNFCCLSIVDRRKTCGDAWSTCSPWYSS